MSRRLLLSLLLLLCAPVAPHSPHSPLAMAIQVKLDTLVASTVRTAAYHDEHATVGLREPQFAAARPAGAVQSAAGGRVVAMEQKARLLLLTGVNGVSIEDYHQMYGLVEPASVAMLLPADIDIAGNSAAAFERVLEVAAGPARAVLEADPAATAAIALARAFRGLLSGSGDPNPAVRDMAGCMAWVAGALDDVATMAAMAEHLRRFPYPMDPEEIQPYLRSVADVAAQCHHHHRRPDLARAVWENATTIGKNGVALCASALCLMQHTHSLMQHCWVCWTTAVLLCLALACIPEALLARG